MKKTFEQYMEAISQKQWDNDDEGIKSKFYGTFDKDTYAKVEPLLEKLFTKLNGGVKPEDKTVFIKPISNEPLWKAALKNADKADANKKVFEKLIEYKICSFLPDGSFANTKKAYNNYLKNIYFKDGKKANLTDFLLSRFDEKFITKCVYKKVIQMLTPQEGWTEAVKNNMEFAITLYFREAFVLNDDNGLKARLIPTFIKGVGSINSNFILTETILKQIESKVNGIPNEYVEFIYDLISQVIPVIYWNSETNEYKNIFLKTLYPCSGSRYIIGFSYDHRWVASQSTHQGWKSCMKLNEETAYNHLVGLGTSNGCFIAYLYDKTTVDKEGHGATGRVLLKPFATKTGNERNISENDIIWVVDKEYSGDQMPTWFTPLVTKIIDKVQDRKNKKGIFHFPKNLTYNDGLPWSISTESFEKIVKDISNGRKRFEDLIPEYQFRLIINYQKVLKNPEVRSLLFNNDNFHKNIFEYISSSESGNNIDKYVDKMRIFIKSLTPGQQVEFFKYIVNFENDNEMPFLKYRLKHIGLKEHVVLEIISELKDIKDADTQKLCICLATSVRCSDKFYEKLFDMNSSLYFQFIIKEGRGIHSASILQKTIDNFASLDSSLLGTKNSDFFNILIIKGLHNFKKVKASILIIQKLIYWAISSGSDIYYLSILFECAAYNRMNIEEFEKIIKDFNISSDTLMRINIYINKYYNNSKALSYFSELFNKVRKAVKNNPELIAEYDLSKLLQLKNNEKEKKLYISFVMVDRLKNFKPKEQISYIYNTLNKKINYSDGQYFCEVLQEKENDIFENICFHSIFIEYSDKIVDDFLIHSTDMLKNFIKKLYNKYKEFFPWYQIYKASSYYVKQIAENEFWVNFLRAYRRSINRVTKSDVKKIFDSKGKLDWVLALTQMPSYDSFNLDIIGNTIDKYVIYSKDNVDDFEKDLKNVLEVSIDHLVLPANYHSEAQKNFKIWRDKTTNNVLQEAEDRGF